MARGDNGEQGPPRRGQIVAESPAEVFRELVGEALARQSVRASEETEYYLVNLLTDFIDARRLHPTETESAPTLIELLAGALERDRSAQFAAFRRMGDFALFVSGFFSESLTRRAIDLDYYVAMGGGAYGHASRLAGSTPVGGIFDDLSRQFVAFMDVIGEVSERSQFGPPDDRVLLQLYQRYVRTGSLRALRQLEAAGIVPIRRVDSRYRQ